MDMLHRVLYILDETGGHAVGVRYFCGRDHRAQYRSRQSVATELGLDLCAPPGAVCEECNVLLDPPRQPESVSDDEVVAAMEQMGGSFIKQLALLYRMADAANQARLRTTFRDYWDKYRGLAAKRRARLSEQST